MYTPKTLVPYGLNFEDGINSCAAMSGGKSFLLLAGHCQDIGLYGSYRRLDFWTRL